MTETRPPKNGSVDPKTLLIKRPELRRLDQRSFPDQPLNHFSGLPLTVENLKYLLDNFKIIARFNVSTKKAEVLIPGHGGSVENAANTAITHVQSLATRHGMATGMIQAILDLIADRNPYNPVQVWIDSEDWDGVDRLPKICSTLVTDEDFPVEFRDLLVRKWLLSAVAAVLVPNFRSRGILTLQGEQGLGKTSWFRALVPDPVLSAEVVRLDHHLDSTNKDSVTIAISHWIVEIGELESSLKRDVARLKGFITLDRDKIRKPYAKEPVEYARRTVFGSSVNSSDFLLDSTGNSRFWTLPLVAVNHDHRIDMQQVFAQLAIQVRDGAEWWLSDEEEQRLAKLNARHRAFSPVLDVLQAFIDFDPPTNANTEALTATEILTAAGIDRPSNQQVKEGAALLREHLGAPKRIRGRDKYRFVRKPEERSSFIDDDDAPDEEMPDEEPRPRIRTTEPRHPKPKFD